MGEIDPQYTPKKILRVFERRAVIAVVEEYDTSTEATSEREIVVNSVEINLPVA